MRELLFTEAKNFKLKEVSRENYNQTKAEAKKYMEQPLTAVDYSKFDYFYKTGNRSVYEKEYFERRGRLNAFALLCLTEENPVYIEQLENTIWAICDEFAWAVPSHIPNDLPMDKYANFLELFASETAFALSEIYFLLKDKLSGKVAKRIEFEIRRRVIEPFLSDRTSYSWETCHINWAAVCAGSVGATFLYLAKEDEIKVALEKINATMQCYLEGFGSDGACIEGYSYWRYGFGFFVCYASLLRQYTNGEFNWFALEKVHNIAKFQQAVILNGFGCVNFSDSIPKFIHNMGLTCFLHREYDDVLMQPANRSIDFIGDSCHRWCSFIRDFVWAEEFDEVRQTKEERTYILDDAAWYIKKTFDYCFAAKAGSNDESHNHNDVGSFLVHVGDDEIICDLGCGEYTHEYFFSETRYNHLVTSSRGHSVPIVNGELQRFGGKYKGIITECNDNMLEIEFAEAYEEKSLKSLKRRFEFGNKKITLIDKFELCKEQGDITERFITKIQPILQNGKVIIGGMCLDYDEKLYSCKVNSEEYINHRREKAVAYLIDFKLIKPQKIVCFILTLKLNNS